MLRSLWILLEEQWDFLDLFFFLDFFFLMDLELEEEWEELELEEELEELEEELELEWWGKMGLRGCTFLVLLMVDFFFSEEDVLESELEELESEELLEDAWWCLGEEPEA